MRSLAFVIALFLFTMRLQHRPFMSAGRALGRVGGDRIFGSGGRPLGRFEAERLHDVSGRLIGRIDAIASTIEGDARWGGWMAIGSTTQLVGPSAGPMACRRQVLLLFCFFV